MTAPDVRTAARKEAFTNLYSHKKVPDRYDADLLIAGFMDGAVWGAALVTPTREQIAKAMLEADPYPQAPWEFAPEVVREAGYVLADAVLALIRVLGGDMDE
ncbi:hypothetical protein EDF60_1671 [Leucobacter luti]|uniref:hypothetical protein n=1 Tax=Leucobacter luti TaxID=340320 RepID=UPI00104F376B|nr:hypothetical protein [Leucobacter luti]MCW2287020.1 hypothetical protein [Leucobacter luti]TCK41245.1 hypothetical protein EDF60_1671 [Leucobacter luti]